MKIAMGLDPTRNAADYGPQVRYEALVVPHLDRLLGFARRRTESLADAEDAVQEACARAWLVFGELRDASRVRPWLASAGRRECRAAGARRDTPRPTGRGPAHANRLPATDYPLRIVDGNHLPATGHRVAPLRTARAAALPGLSLVAYDPATDLVVDLVVDLVPGEDALAGERMLMPAVAEMASPGELWIADRNFVTRALLGAAVSHGAAVAGARARADAGARGPESVAAHRPLRGIGRCETGIVYEQALEVPLEEVAAGRSKGCPSASRRRS